jgi:hypothetical protein
VYRHKTMALFLTSEATKPWVSAHFTVAEVLIAHKSYASFCTAAFIAPIKFTRTSYSRSGSRISLSWFSP